MKTRVPSKIVATSLNLGLLAMNAGMPKVSNAVEARASDALAQVEGVSVDRGFTSVSEPEEEYFTMTQEIPVDIEWDKTAEKEFQSLAVKEALETITLSERVELEKLTRVRRRHTARPVSADEMIEELRQWRSVNRVISALERYVEEIGIRPYITNRP